MLQRLQVILSQPIDFRATDTETTLHKVRLLVAAATYFNVMAVTDFGGRLGPIREEGLDEDAVVALCFAVSAGEIREIEPLAAELRQIWGLLRD